MNLSNFFKKQTNKTIVSKQLDKNQLAQVIGGTETNGNTTGTTPPPDRPKTVTISTSHIE